MTHVDALVKKRRLRFDIYIAVAVVVLGLLGCVLVFSATGFKERATHDKMFYLERQVIFFVSAFAVFLVLSFVDYSFLKKHWCWLYIFNIALLSLVVVAGKSVHGSKSWFGVGELSFQPSELAKVLAAVTYSAFIANRRTDLSGLKDFVFSVLHFAPIVVLVILQPDLGTASIFFGLLLIMMFVAGVKLRYIFLSGAIGLGTIFAVVKFGLVKEYIVKRFMVYLNPNIDPQGAGYTLNQSLATIASGGFLGTGLFKGVRTHIGFVPESHTDFIFTVLGEEMGFVGALILFTLYGLLILRCVQIAYQARDRFGAFLCVGIASLLACQVVINVGMTIGLMPITGIPLPMISYGGSSLLSYFMGFGLVESVYRKSLQSVFEEG